MTILEELGLGLGIQINMGSFRAALSALGGIRNNIANIAAASMRETAAIARESRAIIAVLAARTAAELAAARAALALASAERAAASAAARTARVIGGVGIAVLGVGALAIGATTAVGGYFSGIIGSVLALKKASEQWRIEAIQTGSSVKEIQQLHYAAVITDADIKGIIRGMNILSQKSFMAGQGMTHAFRALYLVGGGFNPYNATGKMKSSLEMLKDLAEIYSKMPEKRNSIVNVLSGGMGSSGTRILQFLKEGRAGIEALMKEAETKGLLVDDATVQKIADLDDSIKLLGYTVRSALYAIAGPNIDNVHRLVKALTSWIEANKYIIKQGASKPFEWFVRFIEWLADHPWTTRIAMIAGSLALIIPAIAALQIAIVAGAFAALVALNPLTLTLLFFIGTLEDLYVYFKGGNSLIGLFIDEGISKLNKLSGQFKGWGKELRDWGDLIMWFVPFLSLITASVSALSFSIGGLVQNLSDLLFVLKEIKQSPDSVGRWFQRLWKYPLKSDEDIEKFDNAVSQYMQYHPGTSREMAEQALGGIGTVTSHGRATTNVFGAPILNPSNLLHNPRAPSQVSNYGNTTVTINIYPTEAQSPQDIAKVVSEHILNGWWNNTLSESTFGGVR